MHDGETYAGRLRQDHERRAYKKADYIDLLSLLYFFVRLASTKGRWRWSRISKSRRKAPRSSISRKILANHHARR
jgi:chemotaxis protein MotA